MKKGYEMEQKSQGIMSKFLIIQSLKAYQKLQKGVSRLTLLVFGSMAGILFFCAWHIVPFYYYYFELMNQMHTVIGVAYNHTDQEIRQKLMYHIKKMEIPMEKEDLKIMREDGMMFISLEYQEIFYISFNDKDYDIHTFEFHASASGPI